MNSVRLYLSLVNVSDGLMNPISEKIQIIKRKNELIKKIKI
jgi:hypothetical protein